MSNPLSSLPVAALALSGLVSMGCLAAPACTAQSASTITPVVELYTSEGCNSCPPADKWLSGLKNDPAVVALAFHVDYWDRLGWKDRFASPTFTQRQSDEQQVSGARFSYTPQLILNGIDSPHAQSQGAAVLARVLPASTVDVELARADRQVTANVRPLVGAPAHLAAYWAVTEQGYVSNVKAGENSGVTLHHDFVVRDYRRVAAWSTHGDGAAKTLQFELTVALPDPAHARQIDLVVTDADTGRPVQAAKLGC